MLTAATKVFADGMFVVPKFVWDKHKDINEPTQTHGRTHEVKRVKETGFGPRFEVEGKLETPDGRAPLIRTVWQMDKDAVAPRLITAYPLEAR